VSAELAARRTAAAALVADFRRWAAGELVSGDWQSWSLRLASALGDVLAELSRTALPAAKPEPGGAYLTPADMRTVLEALDVAADYKRDRAANCADCDASPADLCGTCEWRLHVADGYDALTRRLADR
jgi:hypothetical protein